MPAKSNVIDLLKMSPDQAKQTALRLIRAGKELELSLAFERAHNHQEGNNKRKIDLRGIKIDGANFIGRIVGVDFRGASLKNFNAIGCFMDNVDFRGASFEEETGFERVTINSENSVLFQGASFETVYFDGAMLEGAEFSGANLEDASFEGASLVDTKFCDVLAIKANFKRANLALVNFSGTRVDQANFSNADLTGAIITAGQLKSAKNYKGAILDDRLKRELKI